jgi:hypothetical protein
LVSHSGNRATGEFAYSLNLTDLHTTWTETRAVLGKGESAVVGAFQDLQASLPFRLLGIDSDNGSEFINWHLGRWCARHDIQFTRSRPYQKDDNAHVEQKNWTHVRKLLAWDRYDTPQAVEAIHDLYRNELRLWMNLFQPSVKLLRKIRVGSKLRRKYSPAQTPLDRVLASEVIEPQRAADLRALRQRLDPFELGRTIDRKLERIYALADRRLSPRSPSPTSRAVTFQMARQVHTKVTFLNGLTRWRGTTEGWIQAGLLQLAAQRLQGFFRQGVVGRELQGLFKVSAGLTKHLLRHVHTSQVVVRIVIGFVAAGLQRPQEPGLSLVVVALLDQIGADVVVRVPKLRVDLDGFLALGDGFVEFALEAIGPAEKGIGLCRRVKVQGAAVKLYCHVIVAAHLILVGFFEQIPRGLEFLGTHRHPFLDIPFVAQPAHGVNPRRWR